MTVRSYHSSVEALTVIGGSRLSGSVQVTGAKNSVLKLMAASLLAEGTTTITNVPDIVDVEIMSELLRRLDCDVQQEPQSGTVTITVPERPHYRADYDLVRKMRASICVLGPLLSRCGEADVALPGGDNIGSRGLDLHIDGLQRMGAHVVNEHGYLIATAQRLQGANIWLDFPSVGATETLDHGGCACTGRYGHRQRSSGTGDRRHLFDAGSHGCAHRGDRYLHGEHRRRGILASG